MSTEAVPTGNLEITVSRAELLRELTAAQSVVERKTTIPILSNFLFEAMGGKLRLVVEFPDRKPVTLADLASLTARAKRAPRNHKPTGERVAV